MQIKVTDAARDEVLEQIKGSGYKNPVLRINMAGAG